jgi:predicted metal-binding membrane protein
MPATRIGFIGFAALLFAFSAKATVTRCLAMTAMGGMPMPGGWTLSTVWTRMPGQSWPGTAAVFIVMWVTMMTVMMLPAVTPALWRYRVAVGRSGTAFPNLCAGLAAAGYFFVWIAAGLAVFPAGAMLAELEMRIPTLARAVPLIAGMSVVAAGALQFTAWKKRWLACCRKGHGRNRRRHANPAAACLYGCELGVHCLRCCAGFTLAMLALGAMDLWVMAAVTVAIAAERRASHAERIAQSSGVVMIGAGLLCVARAAGSG